MSIAHNQNPVGNSEQFNISYIQAIEKAEKEFEIYRKHEMELLESDFDKEIKRLKNKNDNSSN